eukprot:4108430-Karenia_brevis.AAC.1
MHMGKTKVISNLFNEERQKWSKIAMDGKHIDILAYEGSVTYLGRSLSACDFHEVEIRNRISRGWAKFAMYKRELCSRHYPLRERLRLFESVITPTVLYSCGTWTMVGERETLLRTAQRKMLRKIVRVAPRFETPDSTSSKETENDDDDSSSSHEPETFADFFKRATETAETQARKAN